MLPVVANCVRGELPLHESAQVRLQCAEKQMEVIGHQHVCVDFYVEQSTALRELVQK